LNLNVWTPAVDNKKRPVIFFIHGGGHFAGANSDKFFDGPHLIQGKDVVMVAANYRLGAFGYLYLTEILGKEYQDSGNCGLLDQILALKWVWDNIASFGGDPDMVVLMGQSAGGKSVANILMTPRAKGLYHRAMIQSGSVQCIRDTHTATMLAKIVLEKLGVMDNPKDVLTKSGEEIIAAQQEAFKVIEPSHFFGPVLDGITIMEEPRQYIENHEMEDIPVMIGYNKEELWYSDPEYNRSDLECIAAFQRCYGVNWEIVYQKYEEYKREHTTTTAFDMTQTLCVYGSATIALTQMLAEEGYKVWSYRWDYGGDVGRAQHTSEMPYVFGYITQESITKNNQTNEGIAKKMNETWMAFVCKGSPENEYIPKWPPCTDGDMGYRMHLDKEFHLEEIDLNSYYKELPMQVIKL
jgi:para-nitrobenzyl esterase